MSLSYDEALTFLKDVLEVPSAMMGFLSPSRDSKPPSTESRALLLHRIVCHILAFEPFQSISLMSTDATDRKRPEWEEIKTSMFLKQGGLCYSINSFTFVLLQTLGYEVSLAHCTVICGAAFPDNHVVIFVHSLLKPGDIFLVDAGFGYAMARAVPLDFEEESPVYIDSLHTYKLERRPGNKIYLLQQPVKSILQEGTFDWKSLEINSVGDAARFENSSQTPDLDIPESGWRDFYFFDPTERHKQLDEFFRCFDICYSDVTKLTTHRSPRAVSWPGGRLQAILHSKLSLENSQGELLKYEIGDLAADSEDSGTKAESVTNSVASNKSCDSNTWRGEENCQEADENSADVKILQAYQRLYPQFPRGMVMAALKNWRKSPMHERVQHYLA